MGSARRESIHGRPAPGRRRRAAANWSAKEGEGATCRVMIGYRYSSRRRLELGIALRLELAGEIRPARLRDAALGEHVDLVGDHVVQEALVMGDEQHGALWMAKRIHAVGDDP